jgi:hypothetical protein
MDFVFCCWNTLGEVKMNPTLLMQQHTKQWLAERVVALEQLATEAMDKYVDAAEKNEALQRQVEGLWAYATHRPDCARARPHGGFKESCGCGLDALEAGGE